MTEIAAFYRPLRIMLGDLDASVQRYPDGTLSGGVLTTMQLNKLPSFSLTPDQAAITPDLDANSFALCCYHTCRLFVAPTPDRYSFRTRAFSESFGSTRSFLQVIEKEIYQLENGSMFDGWQSYFAWLSGMAGLPLAEVLTDMGVQAPLWNATLTREGIRTIPNTK